jgi:lambda family phage minor tail protein L
MALSNTDKLNTDAPIELVKVVEKGGAQFHFSNAGTVTYNGITYTGYPNQYKRYTKNSEGKLPTPELTLDNSTGIISTYLAIYKDFINAAVYRFFVYRQNLDDGTNPDITAYSTPEVYYVDFYTADDFTVTLNLRSALEVNNLQLPKGRLSELK